MKKTLLSAAFFCVLTFSYAQYGQLDPAFGNNGIVTANLGSTVISNNYGVEVLTQPDGSIFLVFQEGDFILITKKHADGSPDLTYGTNGVSAPALITGKRAVLQTDGKIIVVGGKGNDFAIARFNTNGSLDNTFNGGGITYTGFTGNSAGASSVAIQSDGKIIVVGNTVDVSGYNSYIAILRYNTNGGVPELTKTDNSLIGRFATSVAIQSDGKIVIAGNVLLRYNPDFTPDISFNGNKILANQARNIVIQNDGKILVASYVADNNGSDFAVYRFNTNGTPDNTFSGDGIQTTDFGGVNPEVAISVAVQADGKIILGGYTQINFNENFAIARYNADGSPDNNFSGDGKQITDFGIFSSDDISSITLQSDGKLLALGNSIANGYASVAVARYNTDGAPDNTFDGDGLLTAHTNFGGTLYTCTAVQGDGKVVAAGYTWNGFNHDFVVARYNSNGNLDNSFSGDGILMTDLGAEDTANAIAIQPDGKILVGGSSGSNFALARYNSNGAPDLSFDGDGLKTTDFGGTESISSLAIQSDGKFLAAGGTILARYNSNGSPDLAFDGDGIAAVTFIARDIAIQSDGKIAIAGYAGEYGYAARYNTDGSPDAAFGSNGVRVIFEMHESLSRIVCNSIAIQTDGKLIIGGYYFVLGRQDYSSSSFLLIRLNTDGTRDETLYNRDFYVLTNISYPYLAYQTSLIIQGDGKIVSGGYNGDDFALVRYNPNGSLDNTFGIAGIRTMSASPGSDRILGLAYADNSLYVAGYGTYPRTQGVIAKYLLNSNVIVTNGILEAELAVLNRVTVATNNAGYTGTGFADYTNNTGDYIEWTLNKTDAGPATLSFRYALAGAYGRPLRLEVNGVVVAGSLAFPSTGSWTTWSTSQVIANLIAGSNTIRLTTIGSNGPNVDHLAWQNTTLASGILEAELAALNQVTVASSNTGFTGTGYADYTNNFGDYIEWTLNKTNAGTVALNFRYALAGSYARPVRLTVNGVVVSANLAFPSTGSWTTWLTSGFTANLLSGSNKIRLTTIGSNGPNVDHLAWNDAPAARTSLPAISIASPPVPGELTMTVSPNPSVSSFSLLVNRSNSKDGISLVVTDILGRIVEVKNNIMPGKRIEIGSRYRTGTYIVKIIQGGNYKSIKIIKGGN